MKYDMVILDRIACQCFIDWTYLDTEIEGKEGLFKLYVESAKKVGNKELPCIFLTSITLKELEQNYDLDKGINISCFIGASGELQVLECTTEEESILKMANLLKWKKFNFCILTGNSVLCERAKKENLPAFELKESSQLFE